MEQWELCPHSRAPQTHRNPGRSRAENPLPPAEHPSATLFIPHSTKAVKDAFASLPGAAGGLFSSRDDSHHGQHGKIPPGSHWNLWVVFCCSIVTEAEPRQGGWDLMDVFARGFPIESILVYVQ